MADSGLQERQVIAVEGEGDGEQLQERRLGARLVVADAGELGDEGFEVVGDDGVEEIGLIRETGEDRAGREAGGGGDVPHRGGVVTALVEEAFGGVQQLAARAQLGKRAAGQRQGRGEGMGERLVHVAIVC